jgi:AcrR family transcriptional regulator
MLTSPVTKKDTKAAIMDTAEVMMSEHGVNGVSIRAILAEAGANPAALHYHFNTREGLIVAMIARYGRDPSLRRLELIAEFDASGRSPTPQDVVNFVVDPMIELLENYGEAGRRFIRFVARLQSDRTSVHITEERKHFPEIRERMQNLLQRACPHVAKAELAIRITMMTDTMLQSLSNAEFMATEWDDDGHEKELTLFARRLKAFLAGGVSASPT